MDDVKSVEVGDLMDCVFEDWAKEHFDQACVGYMEHLLGVKPVDTDVAWQVFMGAMKDTYNMRKSFVDFVREEYGDQVLADYVARCE